MSTDLFFKPVSNGLASDALWNNIYWRWDGDNITWSFRDSEEWSPVPDDSKLEHITYLLELGFCEQIQNPFAKEYDCPDGN